MVRGFNASVRRVSILPEKYGSLSALAFYGESPASRVLKEKLKS